MRGILLLALASLAPGVWGQSAGIAGFWEYNPQESDDAAAMAREWMGGDVSRPRGLERRTGGPPGFLIPPDSLEIEADADEVRIYTGDDFRIFYLDVERRLRQDPRGNSIETVAKLSGGILTITEKREFPVGKMETVRTFQSSGDVLVVRVRMDPPRGDTLTIRSVYRRVS